MSELIERVGADMLKALADLGEPDIDAGLGYLMGVEGVDVGSILARAAILAMRDRDEAMLDAGTAVLWPHAAHLSPGSTAVAVYTAMIDAALEKVAHIDATEADQ